MSLANSDVISLHETCSQSDEVRTMTQEPVRSEETVVARITAEEAKARVDRGEPIAFVDTRNPKAWAESDVRLPGAVRVPLDEVARYASRVPKDRSVVTYCT